MRDKKRETLIYIGNFVSDDVFNKIIKYRIHDLSIASHRLENALLKELSKNDEIDIKAISYVPSSEKVCVPLETQIGKLKIRHIPIEKNKIISYIVGIHRFIKYVKNEIPRGSHILMYAVNPLFIIPLYFFRKIKKLDLITICSELPEFRRGKQSMSFKIKRKIQIFFNRRFDKYILLTEKMKDIIKIQNQPYIVMEGMDFDNISSLEKNDRKNIVMYAGGLHPDNNVLLLIETCERSELVSECWICGSGPQEEIIKKKSQQSNKIKFLGKLSNCEVLNLEKKVKILVNLRSPSEELTKYSFPSKILEYLASGAQVITTKLEGIPKEYFSHTFTIDNLTIEELERTIKYILLLDEKSYNLKISDSLEFLKSQKSAAYQTKRILNLIMQK